MKEMNFRKRPTLTAMDPPPCSSPALFPSLHPPTEGNLFQTVCVSPSCYIRILLCMWLSSSEPAAHTFAQVAVPPSVTGADSGDWEYSQDRSSKEGKARQRRQRSGLSTVSPSLTLRAQAILRVDAHKYLWNKWTSSFPFSHPILPHLPTLLLKQL